MWTPLNPADRPADKVSEFGTDTPMKRAAQPEEIAPAFVFMAAPVCSSYITGEILPIIGGYHQGSFTPELSAHLHLGLFQNSRWQVRAGAIDVECQHR